MGSCSSAQKVRELVVAQQQAAVLQREVAVAAAVAAKDKELAAAQREIAVVTKERELVQRELAARDQALAVATAQQEERETGGLEVRPVFTRCFFTHELYYLPRKFDGGGVGACWRWRR